ncbi:Efflux pump radE [Lachnellula suecica]|uniref:Efflux pump radE n=1 Tax=Lachnellula suecica TaxID=602035 RepID=A0A8T9CN00_9HELO|nr:Efflux pump radE [Lachnellula suecica]
MSEFKESKSITQPTESHASENNDGQHSLINGPPEKFELGSMYSDEHSRIESEPVSHSAPRDVDWDGPDDVLNPMNWTPGKKWRTLGIISLMTFVTPLSSSMFAPAVTEVMKGFKSSSTILGEIVVSIYVLGFAIGPLIIAPMSELYGRKWIYLISCAAFVIFTMACALSSSMSMLIVFRFLAGCAGSTPVTLGGASIGDMFPKEKRGAAMAVWGMGPQLAPSVGPIIGGFLAEAEGWRWVFWLQAIIAGIIMFLGAIILRETYAPVILQRKTVALIRETGDSGLKSSLQDPTPTSQIFTRAIIRPIKMLLFSPIVLLLSMYTAIIFGYLYLFITTLPQVFQGQYGFSVGVSGLTYLGLGIGAILGLMVVGKTSDSMYRKLAARNKDIGVPEHRLPPLLVTIPLVSIAFFGYGWAVETRTHWSVPMIMTALFSMGMMPAFICTNMYFVDAFGRYSASALAASKLLQSVVGAFLPLAGRPLFDHLGLGWGNSVLGFIALTFLPVPWLFFRYGEKLRTRFDVAF